MPEAKDDESDIKQFVKISKEKLGVKLKPSDIKEITRLGKRPDKGAPRNVIIKFQEKAIRGKVYGQKKRLSINKDPKKNVYLNDHLTQHRQNLLYAARQLVKSKKIFAAWSQSGNILVKKTESSKILQVLDHIDLMKIKCRDEDMDSMEQSRTHDESLSIELCSHLSDYDFEFDSDY